jgi:hypothetical protein
MMRALFPPVSHLLIIPSNPASYPREPVYTACKHSEPCDRANIAFLSPSVLYDIPMPSCHAMCHPAEFSGTSCRHPRCYLPANGPDSLPIGLLDQQSAACCSATLPCNSCSAPLSDLTDTYMCAALVHSTQYIVMVEYAQCYLAQA